MRRLALGLFTAAVLWAGLCLAQGPKVRCAAALAGTRLLVDIDLDGFLDAELLKLIRLGLEGQLSVEVAVVQPRRFWFDAPVESKVLTASLRYARGSGQLVLDERRAVSDPAHLPLERVALKVEGRAGDSYRVDVAARLQVVTASSLGRLAGWISGRSERSPTRASVPQNVLRALADDLAREGKAQCEPAVPAGERRAR